MPRLVHGLPVHVLLVHVVVVLVPVAALTVVAAAWWPAARRRLGVTPVALAALALASVPVTVSEGRWLEARVARTPDVLHHASLGGTLWPWTVALLVVAAAGWLLARRSGPVPAPPDEPGRQRAWAKAVSGAVALQLVVGVLATAVAAGTVVQVYRIGESGAKAVWLHNFSHEPLPDLPTSGR